MVWDAAVIGAGVVGWPYCDAAGVPPAGAFASGARASLALEAAHAPSASTSTSTSTNRCVIGHRRAH
jgi:hypothetical protein